MKIISIEFSNINNLKGDNKISFDTLPLLDVGIFAITGPTGSGKSTLLDVITLALFNKIPRFKKAISKSDIQGLGSVMTLHTSQASAKIVYEILGKRYTSSWEVSKNRNGKLRDYQMYIYDHTGTPLDLKRSEVPAKNEEIIGLKYDQFIKSIILSQGQFAKFLKADKNERGQLLENLTGSYIYRNLGAAAYQKHKDLKAKVDLEKELLDNINVLSHEQRKEQNSALAVYDKKKVTVEDEVARLTAIEKLKSEIESNASTLSDKTKMLNLLAQSEERLKTDLVKLQLHEKVSPLKSDIDRYNDTSQVIEHLTKEIDATKHKILDANKRLDETTSKMSHLTKQPIAKDNFMKVMSTFEKEVNTMQQELMHIRSKGQEVRSDINSKIQSSNLQLSL